MKIRLFVYVLFISLFISGCSTNPYPKNPKYKIEKPSIKYSSANKKNLHKEIKKAQGKPYVWAEEGPNKFDCSGFTYYAYGSMGIKLPRVAREQAKVGKKIKISELKFGDLLFFNTTKRKSKKITHVGMYVGNGNFTHASSTKHKVMYSSLSKKYYKDRLIICRRHLNNNTDNFVLNNIREDDIMKKIKNISKRKNIRGKTKSKRVPNWLSS